jgi:hypothetical protein
MNEWGAKVADLIPAVGNFIACIFGSYLNEAIANFGRRYTILNG